MMIRAVLLRRMRRLQARSAGAQPVALLLLLGGRPLPVVCRGRGLVQDLALALPALVVSLLTVPVLPPTVRAAPATEVLPGAELFRNLQLLTLACGRDNRDESCRQARAIADPLLDQPRLSARCKDVLWTIREQAQVAEANSAARRERIDQAARAVPLVCLPAVRPAAASPAGSGKGQAPAGLSTP